MKNEKTRTGLALGGAVIAAVTASLCCTLPLITAVLGVTGLAAAGFFAIWRPYLLVATFALLGLGFYLAYRPAPSQACEIGSACERSPLTRWNRAVLWLVTAVVIVFTAFPYYSGAAARGLAGRKQAGGDSRPSAAAHVVIKIDGMDCIMCAGGLQQTLARIPGVQHAEVSFQNKQATLDYDPGLVGPAHLVKEITNARFKVANPPPDNN